jgi:acetyl-CoA carboxylase biotin carboxyl carrier protein
MSDKKNGHGIEPALVRELAAILRATDLTEIEVEHGELKLRLARQVTVTAAQVTHIAAPPPPVATAPVAAAAPAVEAPKSMEGAVPSPMVGTVYLSPEPGAPTFVKVGDTVTEGQTLMVVEAMKTFNPIGAPRAGKVREILVADGRPVEFGEPLLILE